MNIDLFVSTGMNAPGVGLMESQNRAIQQYLGNVILCLGNAAGTAEK